MLRRLLVSWLIVSILGYGMALAADVHGELQDEASYSSLDSTADQDPHGDSGCGHCSHGATHLLGLEATFSRSFAQLSDSLQCDHRADPTDPLLRLPLRPPIQA